MNDICDLNAECSNTLGSYKCNCKEGYYGDGRFCLKGQCPDSNCSENQKCVSPTGLDCQCKEGYLLDESSTCSQIHNSTVSPVTPPTSTTQTSATIFASTINLMTTSASTTTRKASTQSSMFITTRATESTSTQTTASTLLTNNTTSIQMTESETLSRDNSTILVISSWYDWKTQVKSWKQAALINAAGDKEQLTCFKKGSTTEIFWSCSILWQNQFHIFEGASEKRQISRLNDYKLKRIGDLDFDHSPGPACGVMKEKIYLCFSGWSSPESRRCRRASGPLEKFKFDSYSIHDHSPIQLASSNSKLESNNVRSKLTICEKMSLIG